MRIQFINTPVGSVYKIGPQRDAIVISLAAAATLISGIAALLGLAGIFQALTMYRGWNDVLAVSLLFFVFWSLVAALPFVALIWQIVGQEEISINSTELNQIRSVGDFRVRRQFALKNVHHISISTNSLGYYAGMLGFLGGTLSFDYNGKRQAIGHGLISGDSEQILQQLRLELGQQ